MVIFMAIHSGEQWLVMVNSGFLMGVSIAMQLPQQLDGLEWKICLKWMMTRGSPILGKLQMYKNILQPRKNVGNICIEPKHPTKLQKNIEMKILSNKKIGIHSVHSTKSQLISIPRSFFGPITFQYTRSVPQSSAVGGPASPPQFQVHV